MTVAADRAVPVVAAIAEARGLPGIGVETAHLMTHKIAMRTAARRGGRAAAALRRGPVDRRDAPRRATRSASRRC